MKYLSSLIIKVEWKPIWQDTFNAYYILIIRQCYQYMDINCEIVTMPLIVIACEILIKRYRHRYMNINCVLRSLTRNNIVILTKDMFVTTPTLQYLWVFVKHSNYSVNKSFILSSKKKIFYSLGELRISIIHYTRINNILVYFFLHKTFLLYTI